MKVSKNARTVLQKRYLKKVNGKVVESPEDMLTRVARCIAGVEAEVYGKSRKEVRQLEEAFCEIMDSLEFLPNSPTLMNAGRELQQLSACFVLPVEDSMESIFETLKNAALVHKSGGGTGFSFSRLRPKNDQVRSTGGIASGPVSFMKCFDAATEAVKQGGTRRGANMAILRVDHPDIIEFITCKEQDTEITNFNISVGVTEGFMEAVKNGRPYDLVNPRTGERVGSLDAREVFDLIVEMAWKNGEPGIVFLDRLNRDNPTPALGGIESTNPCGEQPLLPYESCNLGSINLSLMVKETKDGPQVDWPRLERVIRTATRFLDNVIDANRYPIPQIDQMTKGNRKIGLGVMGWADLLVRLRIPYDSEKALKLASRIMEFISYKSKETSVELAREKGPFPNFEGSIFTRESWHARFEGLECDWAELENRIKKWGIRNATTTTIAPTGTISIIAGCSSGIEPFFAIAFTRHVLDDERLVEVNPLFEEIARSEGFYSEELMRVIAERGSVQGVEGVPKEFQELFVTALDISPESHIKVQAVFQGFTDNAVSKTVNFPNQATPTEIRRVYEMAYELGCKGITVYRDGSRGSQVLNVGKEKTNAKAKEEEKAAQAKDHDGLRMLQPNGHWGKIKPVDRPRRLRGFTDSKVTPLGSLYLTLNVYRDHPFELFAQIGKAGSDVTAFTEAIARLISLAFRCGIDPHEVAEQLIGIGGSRSIGFGPNRVRSVPDAIGQFMKECLERGFEVDEPGPGVEQLQLFPEEGRREEAATLPPPEGVDPSQGAAEKKGGLSFNLCPSCGLNTLVHVEGCAKCMACGHSEC